MGFWNPRINSLGTIFPPSKKPIKLGQGKSGNEIKSLNDGRAYNEYHHIHLNILEELVTILERLTPQNHTSESKRLAILKSLKRMLGVS